MTPRHDHVHTLNVENKIPYKELRANLKNAYFQARPGARHQDMWAWVEDKANRVLRETRIGGENPNEGMQKRMEA